MTSQAGKRKGLRWQDLLELALGSLGANALRSSLTILGVAIGVFSVVGVMTALSAVQQSIDSSLNVFGANVLQITRNPSVEISLGGRNRNRWRPRINPDQAQELKERMDEFGIPTALSATDPNERIRYDDRKTSPRIRIVGTNENYLLTNNYELDFGRNLTATDIEFSRSVTVIGREVLEALFPHENPLEKDVEMKGGRYTVIGVLKERGDIFGESMDGIALIPHTKFIERNWHRWRSMEISIQADSVETLKATEDLAIGQMRQARGLEPEDQNNFEITSNQALQAAFDEIAAIASLAGLLVSGIALVCSGIGIMNVMLVSVSERTREIGVRKALGARKRNVLSQFLLEAVFLSEVGAILGIVLGVVTGNVIANLFDAQMIIPWFWAWTAVGVCSLIGIGFGLLPAVRAANLHPVDSLRHD